MSDPFSGVYDACSSGDSPRSTLRPVPRIILPSDSGNGEGSSPACSDRSDMSSRSDTKVPKLNPNWTNTPTIVALVGLPARGKTYIGNRLSRYLNWVGTNCRVFNVGSYRRKESTVTHTSNFFDNNNKEAMEQRLRWRKAALKDIQRWFHEDDGQVAIYDATNVERSARKFLWEFAEKHGFKLFFIESECNDPEVVNNTVREVKLHGPDYISVDKDKAEKDFNERIKKYTQVYQPMNRDDDSHCSFIKLIDVGKSYIVHNVSGHVQSRMVYFLMNLRVRTRSIYLCRHGESEMNVSGRIGGDSNLSPQGRQFAQNLGDYVEKIRKDVPGRFHVWTSALKRTQETATIADLHYEPWKALNEIDAGVCEGLTYTEIKEKYPNEYNMRQNNKYYYRYPMGESYYDLVVRLEPVIMELERSESAFVVCHQAVVRCLMAYFQNLPVDTLPFLKVPLHTVIKMTQHAHSCEVELIPLGPKGVDTHQPLTPCSHISSIDNNEK
ncbi:unnamed protein product [Oikopleura dioica]|uniref:6-phosphofructo-2-kinase domain-containing protein n=1 Tax=Oikopleura dioica TaxID=34765 RepID=E4YA98_OIKDI|nr:unnamed protein product [Oikopleura dioica]